MKCRKCPAEPSMLYEGGLCFVCWQANKMNPKDHSPAPLSPEEKNRAKRRAYYLRHQEKERAKNRERYHRNKNKPAVESLPEADKEECKEYGRKAKRITPERREELRRINKSAIKRLKATQQKMADEKEDEK